MAEESTKKPAPKRTERIGKYEIVGHIATGGMGVIYKARDADLDRLVALKILPPDLATQQLTLIRFYREAKAAAQLRHENIVTLFDVGEANGTHFIALEYIDGSDLQDYINRKCRLDPDEARQIIIQAVRALAHAHEHGIVHRDIKPSNFLLTQKDNRLIVKLTDFGLAIRSENDAEFRITKDKTTVGTVDYMSPEQARDSRSADIRSDIYSLGCTFYHMLAGQAPFARGTLPERIIQHMKAPPPDVRKLNKSVPDPIVAIIGRMLAKKPDDRYQTPADLLHDLEHPELVAIPDKRDSPVAKLERGPTRKLPIDPTQVLEKKTFDPQADEPKQSKNSRAKRTAEAAVEKDQQDKDVEEPTPRDEPWEPPNDAVPEEAAPRKKPVKSSPGWMIAAAGSAGVLGLVLIVTLIFGGRNPQTKKDPDKPPDPPQTPGKSEIKINIPPPVLVDTSPAKMTVILAPLPIMDSRPDKADQAALRREYYGPFTAFPEAPAGATLLRVSRLAPTGANTYRTLADALAQAKAEAYTIIEIHDNGPIYVPALAPLAQRSIVLRGADGFRPLIVWEIPKRTTDTKLATTFLSLTQGKLILDNLDFVMQWSDKSAATLFDLPGSDFHARDCVFSFKGDSQGDGVTLIRRHGVAKDNRLTHTWLKRCYVRGPDVSLLRLQQASTALLVEESLIVGYQQPLLELRGRDQDTLEFYCVRSTMVAGQILLRCQPQGNGVSPTIVGKVLDSILSRDDTTASQGDMIHVADGVEVTKMSWRAANAVYAGWKQLLGARAKNIGDTDIDRWHDHWLYREGDRAVVDNWPKTPPSGLEEQSADIFLPAESPVSFAALTGAGSIGCVIGRLPAFHEKWLERTYQPGTIEVIRSGDLVPPVIDKAMDGFYHGEQINLNKVADFGAYLNGVLQKTTPAPRVVMHLTGKGMHQISPIRVKGVQHLVLYFERDVQDPITLEVNSASGVIRAPLIDMTGGHLEMIGARFRLIPNTLMTSIVQVQGGDLTLTRCWLQGPHAKSADAFQSLIDVSNTSTSPTTLLLRENVLVAGRLLIRMSEHVRLKARNNVFLSFGDGLQMEVNSPSVPMTHVLDHNTWAVKHTFFALKTGRDFQPDGLVTMVTKSNAFLHPFADEPGKGTLLRGAEVWSARGAWTWRGRYNVYDTRLHAYFAGHDKAAGPKQSRGDWQAAWGHAAEQEPLLLAGPSVGKTLKVETISQEALLQQLVFLALPGELRGDLDEIRPPGADLVLLGIKKK